MLADSSYIALLANKKRAQEVIRSLGAQSIASSKAGRCARSSRTADRRREPGRDCVEHHGGDCCRAPAAGEGQTMKNRWARLAPTLFCCSLLVTAVCPAQKPNDWAMQNAMIGPNSPIEIRAGSSYNAQAMYPVPDGPLFPLKASVTWSVEPAITGISMDATVRKDQCRCIACHTEQPQPFMQM